MITVIKNHTIADIKNSIQYLLDKAAESPEVRMLAIEITHNKQDKIAAIYDWIRGGVKYVPDTVTNGYMELFISPVRMVEDSRAGKTIGGDCDDMALLATALYRSVGIRANVVLIDSIGNGLDHAYCQACSDKLGWVNVDPSAPVPLGWEVSYREKIVV